MRVIAILQPPGIAGANARDCRQSGPMGFDPTRKRQRRSSDYLFVAAGVAVAALLVIWAFLG
jgi:hypothetical protein